MSKKSLKILDDRILKLGDGGGGILKSVLDMFEWIIKMEDIRCKIEGKKTIRQTM